MTCLDSKLCSEKKNLFRLLVEIFGQAIGPYSGTNGNKNKSERRNRTKLKNVVTSHKHIKFIKTINTIKTCTVHYSGSRDSANCGIVF
jgi:hypothetical protein